MKVEKEQNHAEKMKITMLSPLNTQIFNDQPEDNRYNPKKLAAANYWLAVTTGDE